MRNGVEKKFRVLPLFFKRIDCGGRPPEKVAKRGRRPVSSARKYASRVRHTPLKLEKLRPGSRYTRPLYVRACVGQGERRP